MKILLSALLGVGAFVPVSLGVTAGAPTPPPLQGPPPITVTIQSDGQTVWADPDVVTASPGQTVEWISGLGDWEVKFKSKEPFGDDARKNGIKGKKGQKNGKAARKDAKQGRYKYDIKVKVGGKNLKVDPEVIIGPGPAGKAPFTAEEPSGPGNGDRPGGAPTTSPGR